jgi:hypothetical protein
MVVTNYDHAKKELKTNCVDFRKLNAIMKENPYLLSSINEVLNIIVVHKTYSFLDGFFCYQYIFIALEGLNMR